MKYLAYWGLRFNPFSKERESGELVKTADYRNAMTRLNFLLENIGLGILTGRPGYGKTSILRGFVDQFPAGLYMVIYLKLATGKKGAFYKSLARELGLEPAREPDINFHNIQRKVMAIHAETRKVPVIILDEAQYLCKDILIDIPILLNFEMDKTNRAVLILCGLPSLNARLQMEQFEPLHDRIIANYDLEGLSIDEARDYIRSRMKAAGVDTPVFEEQAVMAAYSASRSSYRRLDNILEKALMEGCAKGMKTVSADIILQAVEDIRLA